MIQPIQNHIPHFRPRPNYRPQLIGVEAKISLAVTLIAGLGFVFLALSGENEAKFPENVCEQVDLFPFIGLWGVICAFGTYTRRQWMIRR